MYSTKNQLWLQPDHICIARGSAVALNLMFETKEDHKTFLKLWDKYLGMMTEVINYHLSPTDWTIMFRTKSRFEIKKAYHLQREKSKKAKEKNTLTDPQRMLSEHMRIFLSQFVKRSNICNGRTGTKVHSRFSKYILHSHAEYEKIFTFISNQVRIPSQANHVYRADERLYDVKNEMEETGIYRVGNGLYHSFKKLEEIGLKSICLMKPKSSVLRKFIKIHLLQNSPSIPAKYYSKKDYLYLFFRKLLFLSFFITAN